MDNNFYKELTKKAKKEGIQRFVVGGVIVKKNKFLLLKRPKKDFMGGIYELPSGKVEKGEELNVALNREIKEETNLCIIEVKKYLGFFDYVSGSGKKTRQFNFLVYVKDGEIQLSEHDCFVWANSNELKKYSVTGNVKEILEKIHF